VARCYVPTIQERDQNIGYRIIKCIRYNLSKDTSGCFVFIPSTNVRIMRLLLSQTKVTVRVDDALPAPFNTVASTPKKGVAAAGVLHSLPRSSPSNGALMSPTPTTSLRGNIIICRWHWLHLNRPWVPEVNEHRTTGSCVSISIKQNTETSTVKWTVLLKNGGWQRNSDPCSVTLRAFLAEKRRCNVLVEDVANANQHSKPHLQRLETCNYLCGDISIWHILAVAPTCECDGKTAGIWSVTD